ncbi:acyl-CoA dehydrogenase family protein [Yinghuangia sp. ASG 101]|uniref:acyl-CoA dehydrogenase family protein n=1 Tax=Yinghuangia sp. ASG 101 TaxID=2896848 RepID=UPI001E442AA6|nr:acyl-CoA dehydrogenase family protein [Yinghuangia sp. ASG 101]UGQ13304.1 acyl-CoA dehydrogenase family protein [Yinghuangia sp. ASG 101]
MPDTPPDTPPDTLGPTGVTADDIRARVGGLVAAHDPATTDPVEFLGHRFDAGLAWVHFPPGRGGLGAPRALQHVAEQELAAAGAPPPNNLRNPLGLGMAAPTIAVHGTDEQRTRLLRPLWTGAEVWCQLFSEPGAGSDLAGLATRAVRDGDAWIVTGQKVWTSFAHKARWAMLLARTDPDLPKHQGLTYFFVDMTLPGVEVRPLRQATGQAEFNEVFLTDVRVPDTMRVDEPGNGWAVSNTTLMNERVAIGAAEAPREAGAIGAVAALWRERPDLRTPGLHDRVVRAWVDAEVARLANERIRQQLAAGKPGPEGSAAKMSYARINQDTTRLWLELAAEEGLAYDDWEMRRIELGGTEGERAPGYYYLRAKGNSIEGGTTEILRGVIADRVLELPREPRNDTKLPWMEIPR